MRSTIRVLALGLLVWTGSTVRAGAEIISISSFYGSGGIDEAGDLVSARLRLFRDSFDTGFVILESVMNTGPSVVSLTEGATFNEAVRLLTNGASASTVSIGSRSPGGQHNVNFSERDFFSGIPGRFGQDLAGRLITEFRIVIDHYWDASHLNGEQGYAFDGHIEIHAAPMRTPTTPVEHTFSLGGDRAMFRVPEPSTLMLIGLGAAVAGLRRRRRAVGR